MKWQDSFLAYRKQIVADVKNGAICRYKGDWGVLFQRCWLDRWIGDPIKLKNTDVVEVLTKRAK